jgi:DNA-binding winged helix-turn-helix (wHTH) protein
MGQHQRATTLRAGPFSIDLDRMHVTRGGRPIALSGQPLQILIALLAEPGRVVTREELMLHLWPEATRIDTGRRLNTAVRALREALGDGAETPVFIETVRGRGYRWIGDETPALAPARSIWRPLSAAACALAATITLGSGQPSSAVPSAAERESLVRIAAMANDQPAAATAELNDLIATRPRYESAQLLRAELALKVWRDDPSAAHLQDARADLTRARTAFPQNADLAVLDAELILAGDWNWRGAEQLYRRALASTPEHVEARTGLAWLLLNAGREAEAFAELLPLLTRADLEPDVRGQLGWFLLRLQRNDLAARLCSNDDTHLNLLSCRHTALARLGDEEGARTSGLALMQRLNADGRDIASVRNADASEGYERFLAWRTEHFVANNAQYFQRAQIAADAGRTGEAMANLERAFVAREPALVKLRTTHEFAPLHNSPRFAAMLRAIGPA